MILMNVGKLRLKSKKKKLQLQSLTTVIPVLRTQKGMLVWFWPRRAHSATVILICDSNEFSIKYKYKSDFS